MKYLLTVVALTIGLLTFGDELSPVVATEYGTVVLVTNDCEMAVVEDDGDRFGAGLQYGCKVGTRVKIEYRKNGKRYLTNITK